METSSFDSQPNFFRHFPRQAVYEKSRWYCPRCLYLADLEGDLFRVFGKAIPLSCPKCFCSCFMTKGRYHENDCTPRNFYRRGNDGIPSERITVLFGGNPSTRRRVDNTTDASNNAGNYDNSGHIASSNKTAGSRGINKCYNCTGQGKVFNNDLQPIDCPVCKGTGEKQYQIQDDLFLPRRG